MWIRHVSIVASVIGLWCALSFAALAEEPASNSPKVDDKQKATIEVDKLAPGEKGIVIEIPEGGNGTPAVKVQVDKKDASGTGVKVGVGAGKPKVEIDVQRTGDATVDAKTDAGPGDAKDAATENENYLGVFTRPVPDELVAQLGHMIGKDRGLLVFSVLPSSKIEASGIQKHDIILSYDGQDVRSVSQFKKLIAEDKPGATVKLEIIRGAEPQTLEVTLAQRPTGFRSFRHSEKSDRSGHDESLVIRRSGAKPIIINRRLIQVPGVTINFGKENRPEGFARDDAESPVEAADLGVKQDVNRKLLVTTLDGKRFKIQLEYVAGDGAKIERSFEGTAAEIEEKTKDLPQEIRDDVRESVKDFSDGAENKQNGVFRFHIEPRFDGTQSLMRLTIHRMGDAGEFRNLEVEQPFDGGQPINAQDLMRIDAINAELQALSPAIREKVEATLNRVEIPQARVGVEDVQ